MLMNLISLDDYDRERIAHRRLGCQETWKKEGREGGRGAMNRVTTNYAK